MHAKRLIAAVLAAVLCSSSMASVESEMQGWFNEMGGMGNVTAAQVVAGQTSTTYTGGSLYMRTPVRNYQMASFQAPSLRAGCGGIDAFAGSFSFINSENLTALLRNTANNAIGPAFMLAVESISPDIAGMLKWAQDQVAKLNGLNQNSCQLAEGVVSAVGSAVSDRAAEVVARGGGATSLNLFPDSFESYNEWKESPAGKKQFRTATVSADPSMKEQLNPGNLVWEALKKTDIPTELRPLMMSMVGTIIILPVGEDGNDHPEKTKWVRVNGGLVSFVDFVGQVTSDKTKAMLYRCANNDCTSVGDPEQENVLSLAFAVNETLKKGADKIRNREAQSFTGLDHAIYTNTALPLWRITAIGAAGRVSFDGQRAVMAEVIATEVAYQWFSDLVKHLRAALANRQKVAGAGDDEAIRDLNASIASVTEHAAQLYQAKYAQAQTFAQLQQNLNWLHQTYMRSMPSSISNSIMAFSK